MFLNRTDCLFETLKKLVEHTNAIERDVTDEDYEHLYNAAKETDIHKIAEHLLKIPGYKVMKKDDDKPIDSEFLSGSRWFAEGVQSDRSTGLLYNSINGEAACLLFYDKDYDFYVIDYIDCSKVPATAVVRDFSISLTICIVSPEELVNKYNQCLLLQV